MQETSRDSMTALLDRQRSRLSGGRREVSLERRVDRIDRAIRVIIDNKDRIAADIERGFWSSLLRTSRCSPMLPPP